MGESASERGPQRAGYGFVVEMNARRGLVAVQTEAGYSIFEVTKSAVGMGDEVAWLDPNAMGRVRLANKSRDATSEVFAWDHSVPVSEVRMRLLLGSRQRVHQQA